MLHPAIAGYTILKFFHVLFAIIAVGFNASYGIWIYRAQHEREHELHVLKGIKILDDRFANPAYGGLLIFGLLSMNAEHYSLRNTLWLQLGLALYILMALTAILVFTPALKKQIVLLEAGQGGSADFTSASKRARATGMFLGVVVIFVVFLMVTKPT
jgi:predicted integral membrane protein DUF2269